MKNAVLRLFLLLLILSGVSATSIEAKAKKVSVFVEGEITTAQKQIVTSAVMNRLSGNRDFTPFERNEAFLKALMNEQDYQLSGEVPDAQIRKIGNRYGVDYVIALIVTIDEENVYLSARMIDLETGEILKSVSTDRHFNGNSSLKSIANNVAYRLINKQSK